ncbi:RNA-binding protein [Candidatus Nitrospira bockiana]
MHHLVALDLLPSSLTAQELTRLLSMFPGIVRVQLVTDRDGQSLGTSVVEAVDSAHREVLIQALDGLEVFGQTIRASRLDTLQEAAA